ncbi:hypothetical protein [Dietzia kunjamensis]|uniref:hypothetical protein n=1 Tax=Dietzia kunjamensis TaxID=322509 RepID=UPI003367B3AD
MTETTRPAAAGVFIVRDPDVCAALEQLLEPHRTEPAPAPADTSSSQIAALVADAAAVAAELTCNPTATYESVGQMLEHVDARARLTGEAAGREQATAEGREWSEAMDDRVRRAESAVAHSERELDQTRGQLQDALARIAELEARPGTRRSTVSALRLKDQAAFSDLARRMETNALSQPKVRAEVLRIAAKGIRDEIAAVYGGEEKAS